MKKLEPASFPEMTWKELVEKFKHVGMTKAMAKKEIKKFKDSLVFKNDEYQVQVLKMPNDMLHLSIKRIDKNVIHDWRDLWEIKNQILGEESEAVELYPAKSRLVDSANQYHLWGFADKNYQFPFGFKKSFVRDGSDEIESDGSRQRPFKK